MRIFRNVNEMIVEVEREIVEMGIANHPFSMQDKVVADDEGYATKELLGYAYSLTAWNDLGKIYDHYGDILVSVACKRYCAKEIFERVSPPTNPGTSYLERKELWLKFLHDGKFSYTYSERMHHQLEAVIKTLTVNPGSRQAVVTVYDEHHDLYNAGGKKRIPCSMYYQFLLRNVGDQKLLTLIYTMRSCDYYNHFPVDVTLGVSLLEYVADKVGAKPATFIHFMGSLHAYKQDYSKRKVF